MKYLLYAFLGYLALVWGLAGFCVLTEDDTPTKHIQEKQISQPVPQKQKGIELI